VSTCLIGPDALSSAVIVIAMLWLGIMTFALDCRLGL
jgi:hypothetical protein